jgi:hypothetical protein
MQTVKYVKTTAERYTGVETSLLGFPVKEVNAGGYWVGKVTLEDGNTLNIKVGEALIRSELGDIVVRSADYLEKYEALPDLGCVPGKGCEACGVEVVKEEPQPTKTFFGGDATLELVKSMYETCEKFITEYLEYQKKMAELELIKNQTPSEPTE